MLVGLFTVGPTCGRDTQKSDLCVHEFVRCTRIVPGIPRTAYAAVSMIRLSEYHRSLPWFEPLPLSRLPLLYNREHLFPYASYGATRDEPKDRLWRMVCLENEFLRVEVAPDLGGRVYSLFDKRARCELLFSNPVVKPVRILPIWGFISGGMEFNFPIAHSPTSIDTVGCSSAIRQDYGFIRVGEREARTGMEWVVELGLTERDPFLIQRTAFRNQTKREHSWMSWTICAVPSTPHTEFVHPAHKVLRHDRKVEEIDWPGPGLNWERNLQEMTAFFWKPGGHACFGAFQHDLGVGLMHYADPLHLPGKKVWSYGHGRDRGWGQASTVDGLCYCELESGPLIDQGEKTLFPSGAERASQEYWIPVHSRAECDLVPAPQPLLPPMSEPWLGWRHSPWQTEWLDFQQGGPLPDTSVVTGLELEEPLRRELDAGNLRAAMPLALWLAFHGRPEPALDVIERLPQPEARRIAGLILWKGLQKPAEAQRYLEAGPLEDPVAAVELDCLYHELGIPELRGPLLARAPSHRLIRERRAHLALELGRPEETLQLLKETSWPREHQRYVRSQLWIEAASRLGQPTDVPRFLNEDSLASFGAYWSDQ